MYVGVTIELAEWYVAIMCIYTSAFLK